MIEERNEKKEFNYYKYAYPSYMISNYTEDKSSIIKSIFDDIDTYIKNHVYKIGLYDTNQDIENIEYAIKKYYRCSILGDDAIKTYQDITKKLLPNFISKVNEAIDAKVLDKELCSSLFTHFFMILRDFMDKVEEIKKQEEE